MKNHIDISLSQRILILLFMLSFVYLFACQIRTIWPFTIDDMYIPLRYARHWADGFGLVWNVNELPVEGYSNFSFVLLGRMALDLGLNPVFVLKSAGVVGLVLTGIAIYQLSRFWFSARFAVIPCLWLLAYRGQILWSVSGLETTIYQALIAFSIVYLFEGMGYCAYPKPQTSPRVSRFVIAGFLLALAGMTRPEAPALMVLFVCLVWFSYSFCRPREGGDPSSSASGNHGRNGSPPSRGRQFIRSWSLLLVFPVTFLLCFSGYFFWRWHYYGRLFPNPVYCKGMHGSMDFNLIKQYLVLIWPFVLLAIPAIWKSTDRRHYFLWSPSVLYCILLVGASPLVAFDNRLFLPAFVLMLPLALQGIHILLLKVLKRRDTVLDAALYLSAGMVLFFCIPMMTLAGYHHFTQNPVAGERLRESVLSWLENNTTADSRVVLGDSGLIPWRSSLNFTDSYCLNNAEMTQGSLAQMYPRFCKKVLLKKPDVIILTSLVKNGQVIYPPADACLVKRLKSSENYQLQASLNSSDMHSVYRYEIYQIKQNV